MHAEELHLLHFVKIHLNDWFTLKHKISKSMNTQRNISMHCSVAQSHLIYYTFNRFTVWNSMWLDEKYSGETSNWQRSSAVPDCSGQACRSLELLSDVLLILLPLLLFQLSNLILQLHNGTLNLVVLTHERHPAVNQQKLLLELNL